LQRYNTPSAETVRGVKIFSSTGKYSGGYLYSDLNMILRSKFVLPSGDDQNVLPTTTPSKIEIFSDDGIVTSPEMLEELAFVQFSEKTWGHKFIDNHSLLYGLFKDVSYSFVRLLASLFHTG
jgi:hypothetical protein